MWGIGVFGFSLRTREAEQGSGGGTEESDTTRKRNYHLKGKRNAEEKYHTGAVAG